MTSRLSLAASILLSLSALPLLSACIEVEPPPASGRDVQIVTLDGGVQDFPDAQNRPDVEIDRPDASPPVDDLVIDFLIASPDPAILLRTVEISWRTQNADSCTLSEEGGPTDYDEVETTGFRNYVPETPGTKNFRLTCTGGGETVNASVSFSVRENRLVGDQVIASANALAGLNGVNVIEGNLIIRGTEATSLADLEQLVRVEGNLSIFSNEQMTQVAMPNLSRVDDRLYLSQNYLVPQGQINNLVDQVQRREGIGRDVIDFYNRPTTVLNNLSAGYLCTLGNDAQGLLTLENGQARFFDIIDGQQQPFPSSAGAIEVDGENLTLRLGSLETVVGQQYEFDKLITFRSQAFASCVIVSGPATEGLPSPRTYTCNPGQLGEFTEQFNINMSPGGGTSFERTRFTDQGQDFETQLGLYILDEGRVHFVMGFWEDFPLLSGDLAANFSTLSVDELQAAGGPCTIR